MTDKKTDIEREVQVLLELHKQSRAAHFATDVEAAIAGLAEEQIIVRDGGVRRMTVGDLRQTMTGYFAGATFHEWDDIQPPIVKVSDDASIAWMITNTQVRLTKAGEDGGESEMAFVYAGILTYEKRDGRWIRTTNVSTFAAGDE
jgi:hypothetical protein